MINHLIELNIEATHIENILNKRNGNIGIIKKLIDSNFSNVREYPKFRLEKIGFNKT